MLIFHIYIISGKIKPGNDLPPPSAVLCLGGQRADRVEAQESEEGVGGAP